MVERFIRTLREILSRLQTERLTKNWCDLLPKALQMYNTKRHTALGMSPAQARRLDKEQQDVLWMHMYGSEDFSKPRARKPTFAAGDFVVVARTAGKFEKRSQANIWSTAKYKVTSVDMGVPHMYTIEDAKGKHIDRRLYASEMQKTTAPPSAAAAAAAATTDDTEEGSKDDQPEEGAEDEGAEQDVITEILDERGTGAQKQYKVAWYSSDPSWVDTSVITHKRLLSDWARVKAAKQKKKMKKKA